MANQRNLTRLFALKICMVFLFSCQGESSDDSTAAEAGIDASLSSAGFNDLCGGVSDSDSLCPEYFKNLVSSISGHKYLTQEYKKINQSPYQSDVATDKFIEVYVSSEGADDFATIDPDTRGIGSEVDTGTAIIREMWTPSENALQQFTAMVKMEAGYYPEGGDFAYAVIDIDGEVIRGGKLEDCAVCHTLRSSDGFLFGVPELEKTAAEDTQLNGDSLDTLYATMARDIIRNQLHLDQSEFKKINATPYTSALNGENLLDIYVKNTGAFSYMPVTTEDDSQPAVQIPEQTVIVREVIGAADLQTKTYTVMIKGPMGYFPGGGDFYYGVFEPTGEVRRDQGEALEGRLTQCGGCHISSRSDTGFVFGVPSSVRAR